MRTGHMPSRPMNMTALRRLALKGTINANVRIDIDVSQAAGAARAQGSFRLADAGSTTVLEGTELGVLQTTKDWASFTARIRNRRRRPKGSSLSSSNAPTRSSPATGRPSSSRSTTC